MTKAQCQALILAIKETAVFLLENQTQIRPSGASISSYRDAIDDIVEDIPDDPTDDTEPADDDQNPDDQNPDNEG